MSNLERDRSDHEASPSQHPAARHSPTRRSRLRHPHCSERKTGCAKPCLSPPALLPTREKDK